MLKVLLQKQLAEIFRTYFYNAKTNKARSKGATIAYLAGFALLMVGLLGGIFAYLSVSLCGALSAVERANYILRVRAVAKACCEAYMAEVAGVNENADQEGEVA